MLFSMLKKKEDIKRNVKVIKREEAHNYRKKKATVLEKKNAWRRSRLRA